MCKGYSEVFHEKRVGWRGVVNQTTLRAGSWGCAGRHTLEGHQRGAFSGGEIQRLRRLRQEAHTPTVLVAVSDSCTAALPQSAQSMSPSQRKAPGPQSRPHHHHPLPIPITKLSQSEATFPAFPAASTESHAPAPFLPPLPDHGIHFPADNLS